MQPERPERPEIPERPDIPEIPERSELPERAAQAAPSNQSGQSDQPGPLPPEKLKPWYYQYWFFYPTIVFWPLWPILILRSPWHNGLVSGAIAWALLIVGSYLVYQRVQLGGTIAVSTLMFIVPGVIFTVVTQIHWLRNRRRILDAALPVGNSEPIPASQPRPRRQNRRRRASRRR